MSKICRIEDKIKNSKKSENKSLFKKDIGPQKHKLILVPKENKILIEILEDEIDLFKFFLSDYLLDGEYVEDDHGEIHVDVAEGIEEEIVIFEMILKKIKNAFGLDFLPKLEQQEVANLIRAIEHKLVVFDFDDIGTGVKDGRKLKEDIKKTHEKIMPYLNKKQ